MFYITVIIKFFDGADLRYAYFDENLDEYDDVFYEAGVESGDGKIAQCHFHPLAINPGFPVDVNLASKQEYSDHGRSWNTTPDRVGLSGPFAYQP